MDKRLQEMRSKVLREIDEKDESYLNNLVSEVLFSISRLKLPSIFPLDPTISLLI